MIKRLPMNLSDAERVLPGIRRAALALTAVLGVASLSQAQLLPSGAVAVQRATGFGFTEGPLYDRVNDRVLFTNLSGADIVSYSLTTLAATIVDPNSGAANGMFFDAAGNIVSADRDAKRIAQRSPANVATVTAVLATGWNGPPITTFIGPNDLVIDAAGGIYFSDPNYGSGGVGSVEAVYYRSAAGVVSRLLTGFSHPNGLILSPDQSVFYLAVEGEKRIMAYDVTAPGVLANPRQFARTDVAPLAGATNGPDGLTVDPSGNIYAAVQNAVFAWNPAGQRLFSLSVGQDPTNVELGGRNGKTLFITAGNGLYSVGLNIVPKLPGDFEYDGDVDGADLAKFTAEYGTALTAAALNSDANGDGYADGADLLAWQRSLAAPPIVVTVPEPQAVTLTILAAIAAAARCFTVRSRSLRSPC